MTRFSDRYFFPLATIIVLIASFNLFFKLGHTELEDWDEARYGITAFDMLNSGDFIHTTVLGSTDYWNLKPPLGYWPMVASYKIFGVNRFGLRFPSAMASLLSIILLMWMSYKRFGAQTGLIAGIILATTIHFVTRHSGRTGNLDAALTLFFLLFVWALVSFSETKKVVYFYFSAFVISLIFLLKSFSIAFPLGVLGVALLMIKPRLKWFQYAIFLLVLAGPVLIWALLRFQVDGFSFFSEMIRLDLLLMSKKTVDGHAGHALAYLKILAVYFFPWCLFLLYLPFHKNKILTQKDNETPSISIQLNGFFNNPIWMVAILVPLLIISIIIETKTQWYIIPIYPFLALMIAWHLSDVLNSLKGGPVRLVVMTILVILPALIGEVFIVKIISRDNQNLRQVFLNTTPKEKLNGFSVINKMGDDWRQSSYFILYAKKGLIPGHVASIEEFVKRPANHLLFLEKQSFEVQKSRYPLVVIHHDKNWVIVAKSDPQ